MKKQIKKYLVIVIFLVVIVVNCTLLELVINSTSIKPNRTTIVIDAGHGGRDGGSVGSGGTIEQSINLEYANMLKEKLEKAGFCVIMTRKTADGLYEPFANNKKLSDMNKRMRIIKNANPNLVVSIHMNSFSDATVSGSQVFYKIDDEASRQIATMVSESISSECDRDVKQAKPGDYYILNCSYYTSILIECGYLSNPSEEKILNSKRFKDVFTTAVAKAIELYFGEIEEI